MRLEEISLWGMSRQRVNHSRQLLATTRACNFMTRMVGYIRMALQEGRQDVSLVLGRQAPTSEEVTMH